MSYKYNILITGGAGYIGSSVADYLVKKSFNVTVVDKLEYKNFPFNHLLKYKNFKSCWNLLLISVDLQTNLISRTPSLLRM